MRPAESDPGKTRKRTAPNPDRAALAGGHLRRIIE